MIIEIVAEIINTSQGGNELLGGTGWVDAPEHPGMYFMWEKLHCRSAYGKPVKWNFSRYTPHIVIVAIGQNDSYTDDYRKTDYDGERAAYWRFKYKKILKDIRKKYPNPLIILTTTIPEHQEVAEELSAYVNSLSLHIWG